MERKHCDCALIGGTTEAEQILDLLNRQGFSVAVYVATDLGAEVLKNIYGIEHTEVLIGRKDEEAFFKSFAALSPQFVIDASHPYARQVTETVQKVCTESGIPYFRYLRPMVSLSSYASEIENQKIISVRDIEEAVQRLRSLDGNVLLTTGSRTVGQYVQGISDFNQRVYIRVLDRPEAKQACLEAGVREDRIISKMPPYSVEDNLKLIRDKHIAVLVTKDSGREGGLLEKLESVKKAGICALILSRPKESNPYTVRSLHELLGKIKLLDRGGKDR